MRRQLPPLKRNTDVKLDDWTLLTPASSRNGIHPMWRLLLLSGASYSTGAVWSGITVCTFGIHPMWRLLLLSGAPYSTGAVWSGITVCTFGIHPMWRLLLLSGAPYSTGAV
ncbi:uncharacterized protein LOC144111941 isoform X1 [Amblyomma americanum]